MQNQPEPLLLPIKATALKIGLPYRILLEAVNSGEVPHHRLGRSRRLLKIAEVLECMKPVNEE